MSNVEFKLPKIKKIGIDPFILEQINCHALLLGLYDTNYSEDKQCDGYHAFKVLIATENLPPPIAINDRGGLNPSYSTFTPGWYTLTRFHTLTRKRALESAHMIQNLIKSRK